MVRKVSFKDQIVLFTGFRSPLLGTHIKKNGGKVVSSFSDEVTMLIVYGTKGITSSKVKKAKEKKIKIYVYPHIEEFKIFDATIFELTPKLEKLLLKQAPKPISSTHYITHDNGGRPFRVIMGLPN